MNMTLMEKSRCMLNGVGLGQEFWVEEMGTACYLVNMSPSSMLVEKTPHEVWTGNLLRNHLFNILDFLVVMLIYMFQRKIRLNWIIKLKCISLLVIKMV